MHPTAIHCHQGLSAEPIEPDAQFLSHRRSAPLLDATDDFEQVVAGDVMDRPFAQRRKDGSAKDVWGQRERGLPLFQATLLAELQPLLIDRQGSQILVPWPVQPQQQSALEPNRFVGVTE